MFVGIEDPIAIRRTLLQGSKEIITTLQRYEAFQYTQEMKIKELFILKNIMIEISKLGKSLEEALPVHHMGKKMEARKKTDNQTKKTQIPRPKPVSELDRLEEELNAIESRLEGLA